MVWDRGGVSKRRRVEVQVNVDLASLPSLPGVFDGPWAQVDGVRSLRWMSFCGRIASVSCHPCLPALAS